MVKTLTPKGMSSIAGGIPGQTYTPPSLKDGRIEPGHLD